MSTSPSIDDRMQETRGGCWFFVLPIGMVAIIVVGYIILCGYGVMGRPADGDRVTLHYESCPQALPIVKARVDEMGLGDPQFTETASGFDLTAQLPREPARAAQIPVTLTIPGLFEIRPLDGGDVVVNNSHVDHSLIRLSVVGTPSTIVKLNDEGTVLLKNHMRGNHKGKIGIYVDGVQAGKHMNIRPLDQGKLDLATTEERLEEATMQCAERALLLNNGVLPCEVTLLSTTVITKAPSEE